MPSAKRSPAFLRRASDSPPARLFSFLYLRSGGEPPSPNSTEAGERSETSFIVELRIPPKAGPARGISCPGCAKAEGEGLSAKGGSAVRLRRTSWRRTPKPLRASRTSGQIAEGEGLEPPRPLRDGSFQDCCHTIRRTLQDSTRVGSGCKSCSACSPFDIPSEGRRFLSTEVEGLPALQTAYAIYES